MNENVSNLQHSLLQGMIQHLNYLGRVEQTVKGNDDFGGCSHTECALGKAMILHRELVETALPAEVQEEWRRLDQLHAEFHQKANAALGNKDADELIQAELASMKVVDALGSIEEKIKSAT